MKIRIMVSAVFLLFLSLPAYSQTQPDTTLSFPHVVDGPIGSNFILSCLNITNPNAGPANIMLQFYYQNGTPWPISVDIRGIGRRTGSVISFSIRGRGSVLVATLGDSPRLQAGWAKATSSQPVAGTLDYSYYDSTFNLLGEAGWGISKPVRIFQIPAYSDLVLGATGIAWSNPSSGLVTIQGILVRDDGTEIQRRMFSLSPNNQQYGFLKDPSLFDRMPTDGFTGTAYFIASGDITPVALLLTGNVISALAIIQLTAAPF